MQAGRFRSNGRHKSPLTPQLHGPVRGMSREGALGHGNVLPRHCRTSCAHGSGGDGAPCGCRWRSRASLLRPAVQLSPIWQGLYGGVHLGWGWSGDADGVVGGGQLGYNWQSRQFVYGLEADISAADIGISEAFVVPGAVLSASASIDWLANFRGRLGVLVQPNLLVYGTAGLAVVHAQAHGSVTTFGFGQISASASDTGTGLVYGMRACGPRECPCAWSIWASASSVISVSYAPA